MNQDERMKIAAQGERIGIRKLKEWGFKINAKGQSAYPQDVIATLNNEMFSINIKHGRKIHGVQNSAIKNLVNANERGALLFVDFEGKCTLFEQIMTDGFPLELRHYNNAKTVSFQLENHTFNVMTNGVKKLGYLNVPEFIRDILRTRLREDGLL